MASRYDANTKARAVRLVRAHAGDYEARVGGDEGDLGAVGNERRDVAVSQCCKSTTSRAGPSSTETTERHLRAQTCAGIGKQDVSIGWWGCEGKALKV